MPTNNATNISSSLASNNFALTIVSVTLTSAQIKALNATPIQLVAAPGAGKVICIIAPFYGNFIYGGSNVFVAGAGQAINIYYGTVKNITASNMVPNNILTGSTSVISIPTVTTNSTAALNLFENLPVNAYNVVATEITGNAANDNTVTITFAYYIATL